MHGVDFVERQVIKVYKKGIIALPRNIRERLKIEEGTLLEVYVEDGKLVLKPLNLWDRVWKCCRGSTEEAERELDREDKLIIDTDPLENNARSRSTVIKT
jgi:AbrB family looped-hinge helix DNA binding protein